MLRVLLGRARKNVVVIRESGSGRALLHVLLSRAVRMLPPFASVEVAVADAGESCGTIPRRDSNGVCSVAFAGFNVHGRMYTHSRRAFSSGDRVTSGTLA